MLANFFTVVGQVVTLFLMMAVGFVLAKLGKLNKEGLAQMTTLLLYVVSPSLMLSAFQQDGVPTPKVLALGMGALGLYYVTLLPTALLLFRRQEPKTRSVLRFGAAYGNVGFMGIPLLTVILGPETLIYGAAASALMNLFQWTHGAAALGGKCSLKRAVINPGVIPLLVAFALYLPGIRLPSTVCTALKFLGDLNTPLGMVIIGAQMASANLVEVFTQPRLYGAAAFKLLAAPAITALVLLPFRFSPMLYCICVILAATPTAGSTSLLSQHFDQDTTSAAQLVALSTILSIVTLPIFAVLAQEISARF